MKKIMFSERFGLEQAVLAGTKTMTRRIIPDIEIDMNRRGRVTLPVGGFEHGVLFMDVRSILHDAGISDYSAPAKYQPKYEVGEEVAIVQKYETCWNYYKKQWESRNEPSDWHTPDAMLGDAVQETKGWKNKMFVKAEYMPHRIRITGIKLERLQDISDEDCLREGLLAGEQDPRMYGFRLPKGTILSFVTPREAFAALIDRISGRGTWQSNPWMYAYTFELIK